jgi:hypothetical protein
VTPSAAVFTSGPVAILKRGVEADVQSVHTMRQLPGRPDLSSVCTAAPTFLSSRLDAETVGHATSFCRLVESWYSRV